MTSQKPSLLTQMARSLGFGEQDPATHVEAHDRSSTEHLAWSRRLVAGWAMAAAAALLGAGVIAAIVGPRPMGAVLVLGGLVAASVSTVAVTADRRGVRIRFGPLGWPSRAIDIDQIATAGTITVRPAEWGGWGYRIARSASGAARTGVVLRAGEGLHLGLRNGREFAVTVDDAAGAAAVINAYLDPAAT